MFTEAEITEIYCMADDFCKKFASLQAEFMLEDKKTKRRNKPNRMNDAGIMVILILFHIASVMCASACIACSRTRCLITASWK